MWMSRWRPLSQWCSEARKFIPMRILKEFKGTHPWFNDDCRNAILRKQSCEGSAEYMEAAETCTQILRAAYAVYINKRRDELRSLLKGSKRWWSLSKELMDFAPAKSGIPSLRGPGGDWIHDGTCWRTLSLQNIIYRPKSRRRMRCLRILQPKCAILFWYGKDGF